MAGLRAIWLKWRNTLLSDARFQRISADFPLTRRIAHQRTQALFDLTAGFVYSQVLHACVALDILSRLHRQALTIEALAADVDVPTESITRLMEAAEALQLVQRLDERFVLGLHGAALLGAAGLADMIRHHDRLYADLLDPVALLKRGRGERLSAYWPYAATAQPQGASCTSVDAYSSLMAATQPAVAADVLDAYTLRRHRVVMDVGGGEAAFLRAAGARWPHLELRLFDLPAVVDRARARAPQVQGFAGNFLTDALPPGADLITFVRVLHDHDDAGVAVLLSAARAAVAPGGRVLIAEPMSDARRRDRVGAAYFGLYLLAMGRGRVRTMQSLSASVRLAGFSQVRMLRVRTPALLRVLVADA